jgi:hypothetical protein
MRYRTGIDSGYQNPGLGPNPAPVPVQKLAHGRDAMTVALPDLLVRRSLLPGRHLALKHCGLALEILDPLDELLEPIRVSDDRRGRFLQSMDDVKLVDVVRVGPP